MNMATCSQEAVWLSNFMSELGYRQQPITLYCDNQGAMALANNPIHHNRSKHIDIKHHFIRECLLKHVVTLEWVSTDRMVADLLTKPLSPKLFERQRDNLVKKE